MNHWVATYCEHGEDNPFGIVGGLYVDTIEEADNIINRDIDEYLVGLKGDIKVNRNFKNHTFSVECDGNVVCVWEPQLIHPAIEKN